MQLTVNGRARELAPGTSLLELLTSLGIEPRVVIVEHNGRILRPGGFEGIGLAAGDRVEIVHFVGGG
ncbi:MAG TPA: sulfur carrier protein ThiS [Gemmatimonadota bacterium]|jgi:thiamine biosynthesis protein ThiS